MPDLALSLDLSAATFVEGFDVDASAYFTAAGITDATQKTAVNTFILGLKSNSLWTTFYGLYPFVGGTSGAHAVNAKSPGTYDITWFNSPTHNSNGVTGNGTTNYGVCTGLTGSSVFPHLGGQTVYVRTAGAAAGGNAYCGIGSQVGVTYWVAQRNTTTGSEDALVGGAASFISTVVAAKTGTLAYNRTATNNLVQYNNGASIGTNTTNDATAIISVDLGILCINTSGSPINFAQANIAFYAAHSPHDATKAAAFNTLLQALQTSLSRNV